MAISRYTTGCRSLVEHVLASRGPCTLRSIEGEFGRAILDEAVEAGYVEVVDPGAGDRYSSRVYATQEGKIFVAGEVA